MRVFIPSKKLCIMQYFNIHQVYTSTCTCVTKKKKGVARTKEMHLQLLTGEEELLYYVTQVKEKKVTSCILDATEYMG